MNFTIARLTLRSLLGRKRSLLLIPLPLFLIGMTLLGRVNHPYQDDWQKPVFIGIGYAVVVPLLALLIGASVIGSEVDDGTIVHILTKPISRREIVIAKYAVAAVVTSVVTGVTMAICGLLAGRGTAPAGTEFLIGGPAPAFPPQAGGGVSGQFSPQGGGTITYFLGGPAVSGGRLALGLAVGAIVASLCYCALFIALSVVSRRPVLIGLVYILLWEGLLGNLLTGTRSLSIEQFAVSLSAHIAPTPFYDPTLSAPVSVVMAIVFLVAGMWIAIDRLRSFSVKGETA